MTKRHAAVLRWAPRVAAVAMALFLSLFALDAFNGKSFIDAIPGFIIHLRPAFAVLAILWLGWRFPFAGAAGFTLLAIGYGVMVRWRMDWVRVISGPLLVIAILFVVSWMSRRQRVTSSSHG